MDGTRLLTSRKRSRLLVGTKYDLSTQNRPEMVCRSIFGAIDHPSFAEQPRRRNDQMRLIGIGEAGATTHGSAGRWVRGETCVPAIADRLYVMAVAPVLQSRRCIGYAHGSPISDQSVASWERRYLPIRQREATPPNASGPKWSLQAARRDRWRAQKNHCG